MAAWDLFPALRKRRVGAGFGYDERKGVERVIADPWLGTRGRVPGYGLFPALREKRVVWLRRAQGVGACERGPSGLGREGARDGLFPALREKRVGGLAD